MKWSLLELNKYKEEPLVFSETLHLKKSFFNEMIPCWMLVQSK